MNAVKSNPGLEVGRGDKAHGFRNRCVFGGQPGHEHRSWRRRRSLNYVSLCVRGSDRNLANFDPNVNAFANVNEDIAPSVGVLPVYRTGSEWFWRVSLKPQHSRQNRQLFVGLGQNLLRVSTKRERLGLVEEAIVARIPYYDRRRAREVTREVL
jgi:hypothetical protein